MPWAKKANDITIMINVDESNNPTNKTGKVKVAARPIDIFRARFVFPVLCWILSESQPPITFAIPKAKNGIHKMLPIKSRDRPLDSFKYLGIQNM